MNVCILKESLCIGGTERSAANVSKVLSKDYNVFIALYDASKIQYSYSGQLVDFHLPPKASVIGKVLNTFLRDIKLRRLLKKNHIEVLYTFTGIVNRQTHFHYCTEKIISARDFGGMYELHNRYKNALDHSSAMICNSEYIRKFYLSKYPADTEKVFTLYNYIDISEIHRQSQETVEQDFSFFLQHHKNTIVSVGRFCKEKGFEYLLEAFAEAREKNDQLGLVLVGDGDYKQKYLEIIEQLSVGDHVYFTGFQKNPYKYMTKCTWFVLSSLSEGFPNVLAEAMALALPAIATNCFSGPAEILRKDADYYAIKNEYVQCDYGIITPTLDVDDKTCAIHELARAISDLLSNQKLRAKYAELAIQRAEVFSEEAMRVRLNEIFNTLIKRREA